jgi:esterase/lipase
MEASYAINLLDTQDDISLIGFSMSGEVSIRLTQYHSVKNLFLFAPGIYHQDVIEMPFDHNFTLAIRSHESWKNNAIPEILSHFQ